MAIDEDPLQICINQLREEQQLSLGRELNAAAIAGVLSLIPGIGSALQSLVDGKARKYVEERWLQLFSEMIKRLQEIRDNIDDVNYYCSEEFQAALAQAQQELLTTSDREKIRMLACALANSGSALFRADDKELMIRALRLLSPADIKTLNHDYLRGWTPIVKRIDYGDDIVGSLSRLASVGLVIDVLQRPDPNLSEAQKLQWLLSHSPSRTFRLTKFGERFIQFIATEKVNQNQ